MYLQMTENEFNSVVQSTPRLVAEKLGIDIEHTRQDLGEVIKDRDMLAHGLMTQFLETYRLWWDASNRIPDEEPPNSQKREELIQIIDQRDEIRRALVNYLNFAHRKKSQAA